MFKIQISPAWNEDTEDDSSEPRSCSSSGHAEKWPNNPTGRWAHSFCEFSGTQYVYPLREQGCDSSSLGTLWQGFPGQDLGSIKTSSMTFSMNWPGALSHMQFYVSQNPHRAESTKCGCKTILQSPISC